MPSSIGPVTETTIVAPYLVAAALLVVAGAAKLRRPTESGALLRALPGGALTVTVLTVGAIELTLGLAAVAWPHRALAGALAVVYLAFATVVLGARLVRPDVSSCGCFGAGDAPPSFAHVLITMAAAATAGLALVIGPPSIAGSLLETPLAGAPLLLMVACATAAAVYVLTTLPRLTHWGGAANG